MIEITNKINKLKIELKKEEALLKEFCLNKFYDIEWRFEVWEEYITKNNYSYNPFSNTSNFANPIPQSIVNYYGNCMCIADANYEDLIAFVTENYLQDIPEEDLTDDLIDKAFTSDIVKTLKEWIISENIGEWKE